MYFREEMCSPEYSDLFTLEIGEEGEGRWKNLHAAKCMAKTEKKRYFSRRLINQKNNLYTHIIRPRLFLHLPSLQKSKWLASFLYQTRIWLSFDILFCLDM